MDEAIRSSAGYLFFPAVLIGFFGLLCVVIGLSAQRTRRLSNAKFLWLATGTREFEGRTAVFLGEFIAFVGYVFTGLAALAMVIGGFMVLAKLREPKEEPPAVVPAYNTPVASSNGAKQEQPSAGTPSPGANSSNGAGSYGTPPGGSPPKQEMPPGGGAPGAAPWGGGPPPWAAAPPGGLRPPGGFGSPSGGDFSEQFRKSQEEFEKKRREMEERHRNFMKQPKSTLPTSPPASKARPIRQWKSANGKFTVTASLVEQTPTEAVLKKTDGSTVRVEKSKLSGEDQKWLADNP